MHYLNSCKTFHVFSAMNNDTGFFEVAGDEPAFLWFFKEQMLTLKFSVFPLFSVLVWFWFWFGGFVLFGFGFFLFFLFYLFPDLLSSFRTPLPVSSRSFTLMKPQRTQKKELQQIM